MADDDQSIRDMADAETADNESAELFPIGSLEGDEKTLAHLVKPSHSTEITVSMMSAEVPAPRGGLLDPDTEHLLLVTCEWADVRPVPIREGDRVQGKTIKGWKLRQQLRPIYLERVKGEAGALEAAFADLLKADEGAAMALLDRLSVRASNVLGAPA